MRAFPPEGDNELLQSVLRSAEIGHGGLGSRHTESTPWIAIPFR